MMLYELQDMRGKKEWYNVELPIDKADGLKGHQNACEGER